MHRTHADASGYRAAPSGLFRQFPARPDSGRGRSASRSPPPMLTAAPEWPAAPSHATSTMLFSSISATSTSSSGRSVEALAQFRGRGFGIELRLLRQHGLAQPLRRRAVGQPGKKIVIGRARITAAEQSRLVGRAARRPPRPTAPARPPAMAVLRSWLSTFRSCEQPFHMVGQAQASAPPDSSSDWRSHRSETPNCRPRTDWRCRAPCTLASTTPCLGSSCMRAVPRW